MSIKYIKNRRIMDWIHNNESLLVKILDGFVKIRNWRGTPRANYIDIG